MTSKPKKVYWDSCVFIDCIQEDEEHYPELREILEEAKSEKIILVTSTMAIAELVKFSESTESVSEQQRRIEQFFDNDFIEIRNVNKDIAERSAEMCRAHNLKPPDAIHLVTAQSCECDVFHTYDGEKRDIRAVRKKPYLLDMNGKVGNPPLKIELPRRIFRDSQKQLFDMPEQSSILTHDGALSALGVTSRNSRQSHPLCARGAWLLPSSAHTSLAGAISTICRR
jgi:predicted nucleic acid-binding protein